MKRLSSFFLLLFLTKAAVARIPLDEKVPEVTAYDSKGEPFPFSEKMKGHYSVIVFGCLT